MFDAEKEAFVFKIEAGSLYQLLTWFDKVGETFFITTLGGQLTFFPTEKKFAFYGQGMRPRPWGRGPVIDTKLTAGRVCQAAENLGYTACK